MTRTRDDNEAFLDYVSTLCGSTAGDTQRGGDAADSGSANSHGGAMGQGGARA